MKLKIMHLYPDLLSFYGDSGNIASLTHRLLWRGIDAEVIEQNSTEDELDLTDVDIIFLGGGGEREEKLVMDKLKINRDKLADYIDNDGVVLAVCGGFDMLGKYIEYGTETVAGAGVLDIYTRAGKERASGDVILESTLYDGKIVGFENKIGKTHIGNLTPLGTVLTGTGNNGEDKGEGVVYKNVIGTHLHGPLLPKNPKLSDWLIERALCKKYMEFTKLTPLSTDIEDKANEYIVNRYK